MTTTEPNPTMAEMRRKWNLMFHSTHPTQRLHDFFDYMHNWLAEHEQQQRAAIIAQMWQMNYEHVQQFGCSMDAPALIVRMDIWMREQGR
jgi:hypothetical protein